MAFSISKLLNVNFKNSSKCPLISTFFGWPLKREAPSTLRSLEIPFYTYKLFPNKWAPPKATFSLSQIRLVFKSFESKVWVASPESRHWCTLSVCWTSSLAGFLAFDSVDSSNSRLLFKLPCKLDSTQFSLRSCIELWTTAMLLESMQSLQTVFCQRL